MSSIIIAPPAEASDLSGYQLPWVKGVSHSITGNWYGEGTHTGIDAYALDWNLKTERTLSTNAGRVLAIKNDVTSCSSSGGYGNYVEIDHGGGYRSFYAHLKSVRARARQKVVIGADIGISGNTGNSCDGAHLHFRVTKNGSAHKPEPMGRYSSFPHNHSASYVSDNEFDMLWIVRQSNTGGVGNYSFTSGKTGIPVSGNWDGFFEEGYTDDVGVVRGNTWTLSAGVTNHTFNYGSADDFPLAGDWNGDRIDTPAVVRGNTWFLNNGFDGAAETYCNWGKSTDYPIVGDWNGDGKDDIGVVRGSTWYLNTLTNGVCDSTTDKQFTFGISTDTPIVGNWDTSDKADEVGVVRGNAWYLFSGQPGLQLIPTFNYGVATHVPLIGDWDGNGNDTPLVATRA